MRGAITYGSQIKNVYQALLLYISQTALIPASPCKSHPQQAIYRQTSENILTWLHLEQVNQLTVPQRRQ